MLTYVVAFVNPLAAIRRPDMHHGARATASIGADLAGGFDGTSSLDRLYPRDGIGAVTKEQER